MARNPAVETVLIDSWPFEYGGHLYQREDTLNGLAMAVYSDAASWAGDHQRHPDMTAIARRANERGFEHPFGYPYDGQRFRLTEVDLPEVVRRAQAIYDQQHEVFNYHGRAGE